MACALDSEITLQSSYLLHLSSVDDSTWILAILRAKCTFSQWGEESHETRANYPWTPAEIYRKINPSPGRLGLLIARNGKQCVQRMQSRQAQHVYGLLNGGLKLNLTITVPFLLSNKN